VRTPERKQNVSFQPTTGSIVALFQTSAHPWYKTLKQF